MYYLKNEINENNPQWTKNRNIDIKTGWVLLLLSITYFTSAPI